MTSEWATLASLIEDLRPLDLAVVAAPHGLDQPIGGPVLYDPRDESSMSAGDIVLGVGLEPAAAETSRLLQQLGQANAAALIVKADGSPPPSLVAAATDAGMAVLAAPETVAWGQLYTLMQTAATVGALPAARNGVPIGDLFALADAVAAMVGGATTIEDPGSRVLAYSSLDHPIDVPRQEAILGRRVPANWMRRLNDEGIFRRLWQEDAVIHVHLDIAGLRPRLAVAVRAGGQVLGSIWVIEGEKPFAPEAEAGLKEAAELAAIHLLRHSSSEDIERRHRSEALRALLEGHGSPERGAAILRIGLETPVAVVSLVPVTAADAEAEVQAQRAADLVALYCESYRRRAACVAIGGAVYVLLPEVGQDGRERLVALIETLVQRAHESLRIRLRSGVGSTVAGLAQVAGSRREADQAARALIDDPRGRTVADIDQVRSRVILRELADVAARAPALRAGPLAALATHDAERGTAYVATLGAYLDAFGDVALAATAVNVHPNTFRYRLRRLTEISGLDLDDPDARLVAQLQLRFLAHG